MIFKDGFDRMLEEFGFSIGLEGLRFDRNNVCELLINEDRLLCLRRDDESNKLTAIGYLSTPMPALPSGGMLDLMLRMHLACLYGSGAVIGMEMESRRLVIHQSWQLSALGGDLTKTFISDFIEVLTSWERRVFADCSDDANSLLSAASPNSIASTPRRDVLAVERKSQSLGRHDL